MSDEPKNEEKKIFVDEDWKSRVEEEKETARREQESQEPPQEESAPRPAGPLPPPNLTFLASSLYVEGMVALGLLPHPTSNRPEVNLDQAKHAVDTLNMLEEKTEGNRTPEEGDELATMLHQLRLAYVSVQEQKT